ncbi:unnamed protein product [Acanthoscelides obtectus]|uniref:Endonuclease-reverse transcriptase n=1 Tax=Acanthoscelides obtectus TaxID=200917 RepID=A0A9P0PX28_ACAOB|nr:unnamed protein product [Acanthoscelides obtectus]CAK1651877.1 hypothetical protein AOBTE_LOCUS17512 [Acanthoscelides obtectus]
MQTHVHNNIAKRNCNRPVDSRTISRSVMIEEVNDISNKQIYDLLHSILAKNTQIEQDIQNNKEEIEKEIQILRQDITTELYKLERENKKLKEKIDKLEEELNSTERQVKKYNVIFYGVKEAGDTVTDLDSILKIFNEKLEVKCSLADFRDIHRIGRKQENKIRPVVAEVINYQLKKVSLENSKKLKDTGIYLSLDYTKQDYQQRKILYTNLKLAKSAGLEAKIHNHTLHIGEDIFTSDDLSQGTPDVLTAAILKLNVEPQNTGEDSRNSLKRKNIVEERPKRSTRIKSTSK